MSDFVHLHNHSEFSLLDGLQKIKLMVLHAKELGMKAIAITDHGNMYGTIKFYKTCIEEGIKPIIGCELYLAKRTRFDKEAEHDADHNHLILLAKNNQGYKNLMKLVSAANLEGFYYKPKIDLDILRERKEGLICLTGCINSFFGQDIIDGNLNEAEKKVLKLYDIFGEDLYLEMQKHPKIDDQDKVNEGIIKLSKKLGIPLVATNDNHYIKREDAEAHEILLAIQTQTTILNEKRPLSMIDSPDFYMRSPEEMRALFIEYPEAIENTVRIADKCNVEIRLGKWIMPVFDVPGGIKDSDYFIQQIEKGLEERYKEVTQEMRDRVEYELSIILKKGYETYILIVADFVNWAKSQGITVGPGRGSNAGSIISYALKISDVDPLFFKLPFERFLNPMRPSPPDIDLDFADDRRDEVIAYVTKKYGENKVAQIITFGTMEARGAVRDAGRALGMPYIEPDRIAKMIPPGWQGHAMTIDLAIEQSSDLKKAYNTEVQTKRLLDVAKKLEGVARHASTHAAGVVIADKPLTEYTPVQKESNGEKIVTQYDMYTVGEDGVGLLKIDFLGLRNLTIIQETLRFVKENRDKVLDFSSIPNDDIETYKMLSSGETTGIFQLESGGMRKNIKELKPTTIFDLQAMVALYRPGPMANIPEFIKRKNNPELISYPDHRLEDVLKESYGIITFQDDLLLTAIKVAGYSWLEADKLRKAVGKKIPTEMKKQHDKFVEGCVINGMTQKKAQDLWDLFEPFAGYGFGKAHAACYATIAFRTAYLKTHYPVEFMTAVLTAECRGTTGPTKNEKISQAIAECKRLKIEILPPSVTFSEPEFSIEDNQIRFGLSAIKNVGSAAIRTIIEERNKEKFNSFYEFCNRVDLSKVNKKTLESLIKAGAMDEFGNRASLLAVISEVVEKINKEEKNKVKNQVSLFGDEIDQTTDMSRALGTKYLDDLEDFSEKERLIFERELLGFYLTDHPMNEGIERIMPSITHKISDLIDEKNSMKIKTGGLVSQVKRIITKKSNSEMAFITIEDNLGNSIECVVFPKIYESYKNSLIKDLLVIIEGKLEFKDERPIIITDLVQRVMS
ncbi:DNA polymerase III subunit alpha [Candidatus Parcubacteria bacterium]|nr:MAG: DNA polymerase III subunit alpha [Candidatus Parcubacteria bacterium]